MLSSLHLFRYLSLIERLEYQWRTHIYIYILGDEINNVYYTVLPSIEAITNRMVSFVLLVVTLYFVHGECKSIPSLSKTTKTGKSIDDFHLNLYKSVIALNSTENAFLSPYSIGLALALLTAGARGKTEKELLTLLQSRSRDKLDQSAQQLMNITRMPEIKLANRLYVDQKFPILSSYTEQLRKIYNITLGLVDLNAKNKTSVTNQINQWVSNQTNGHIKEVLDKDSLDVKKANASNALLIINCLFFDGTLISYFSRSFLQWFVIAKWASKFDAQGTYDGNTFYSDSGPPEKNKLTLMTQRGSFPYVDLSSKIGARMVHLPFKNNDFTFTIILPNKDVKLTQVESRLTSALLNSPTTTNNSIILAIPKWKFEFQSDLKDILKKKMKVSEMFDEKKANLKGLSSLPSTYVSNLIHK